MGFRIQSKKKKKTEYMVIGNNSTAKKETNKEILKNDSDDMNNTIEYRPDSMIILTSKNCKRKMSSAAIALRDLV